MWYNLMLWPVVFTEEQKSALLSQVDRFRRFYALKLKFSSVKSQLVRQLPTCLLTAAMVNLMLLIFSLKTWISILFFLVTLRQFVQMKWELIRQKGLIHYMSPDTQALLLHRSIFDVLCDLWFIPRLSLYFKAFLMPMIIKIKPEQAMDQLTIIPEADKRFVLTKGVVYVLPKRLRTILLPRSFELHNKIQEFFEEENENESDKNKHKIDDSHRKAIDVASVENLSQVDRESTHCDNIKLDDSNLPNVNLIPLIRNKIKRENSKVIISSKILREMKELPGKTIDQWDNLSTYRLQKVEKNLKKKSSLAKKVAAKPEISDNELEVKSQKSETAQSMSPISIVLGLINLKKHKLFNRFSKRSLILIFSMSVTIFIFKLGVSSRYRRLTKNLFMTLSFLALAATGSASLLAIAMHPAQETKKNLKSAKSIKANEN